MYGHKQFLIGCLSNWSERERYKLLLKYSKEIHMVAPSLYCSYFGLIQIQRRCKPMDRDLTDEELTSFQYYCNEDCAKTNFGYYKDNIVCVDYPGF